MWSNKFQDKISIIAEVLVVLNMMKNAELQCKDISNRVITVFVNSKEVYKRIEEELIKLA